MTKLSGLKQHNVIILQIYSSSSSSASGSNSRTGILHLTRLRSKCLQSCILPLEALEKNLFLCPSQFLEAAHISCLSPLTPSSKPATLYLSDLSSYSSVPPTTTRKYFLLLSTHVIRLGPPKQSRMISQTQNLSM